MKTLIIVCTLCIGMPLSVSAQDLVYQPVNPSFGGYALNSSHLLSTAQAQNGFTQSSGLSSQRFERNAVDEFKESLNRQILSQLSRQLVTSTFGESELESGKYELGDFIIEISEDAEGVNINIFDIRDGSETNILVPYF